MSRLHRQDHAAHSTGTARLRARCPHNEVQVVVEVGGLTMPCYSMTRSPCVGLSTRDATPPSAEDVRSRDAGLHFPQHSCAEIDTAGTVVVQLVQL